MTADRIEQLEILAAEQERVIADLSAEIAAQWAEIESLRKRMDVLLARFTAIEEAPKIPVTKPPHW